MTIKLEVGKYYKTRDGQEVGPMKEYGVTAYGYIAMKVDGLGILWRQSDGKNYPSGDESRYTNLDIIAEWPSDQVTLSSSTIDSIAIDSLKFHFDKDLEPFQREAFRIVLRYYGASV